MDRFRFFASSHLSLPVSAGHHVSRGKVDLSNQEAIFESGEKGGRERCNTRAERESTN